MDEAARAEEGYIIKRSAAASEHAVNGSQPPSEQRKTQWRV